MPEVGVILGSKSDLPLMELCLKQLEEFDIDAELKICSAHRDPAGVMEWASTAGERGLKVVIAAAGGAAHLPGVVAAWTDLPVVGVPVPTQAIVSPSTSTASDPTTPWSGPRSSVLMSTGPL